MDEDEQIDWKQDRPAAWNPNLNADNKIIDFNWEGAD
jgi:hypothetical protein